MLHNFSTLTFALLAQLNLQEPVILLPIFTFWIRIQEISHYANPDTTKGIYGFSSSYEKGIGFLTLIFSSALLEKNLALTMTGCLGRTPLPSTYNTHQLFRLLLEKPNWGKIRMIYLKHQLQNLYTDNPPTLKKPALEQSMTGAFPSESAYFSLEKKKISCH